jgi:hypothetical protein
MQHGLIVYDEWKDHRVVEWVSPSLTPGLVKLPHRWIDVSVCNATPPFCRTSAIFWNSSSCPVWPPFCPGGFAFGFLAGWPGSIGSITNHVSLALTARQSTGVGW